MPGTPVDSKKPNFPDESHLDAMERALRERKRECEERKQKLLNHYKEISLHKAGK